MYTGKTDKPCCLCGREETDARIDLPPRAIPEMKHSGPIAWRDVVGEVSLHFCRDDWQLVRKLVLEMGLSPLSRCNAAHADFDLRADFEALTNETRVPDHPDLEARMRADSEDVLSDSGATERQCVEALVVRWVLEGTTPRGDPGVDSPGRSD